MPEPDTRFLIDQITEQLLSDLAQDPSFSPEVVEALRSLVTEGSLGSVEAVERALRVDGRLDP